MSSPVHGLFLFLFVTSGLPADEPAAADLEMKIEPLRPASAPRCGPLASPHGIGRLPSAWSITRTRAEHRGDQRRSDRMGPGLWGQDGRRTGAGDARDAVPGRLDQQACLAWWRCRWLSRGGLSWTATSTTSAEILEGPQQQIHRAVPGDAPPGSLDSYRRPDRARLCRLRGRGAPSRRSTQILDGDKPANRAAGPARHRPGPAPRAIRAAATRCMQLLVQDATGQEFPAVARELVLAKLGHGPEHVRSAPPRATAAAGGHRAQRRRAIAGRYHVYPEIAAASLWTTPTDLARVVVEVQHTLAVSRTGSLSRAGHGAAC